MWMCLGVLSGTAVCGSLRLRCVVVCFLVFSVMARPFYRSGRRGTGYIIPLLTIRNQNVREMGRKLRSIGINVR